MGQKANFLTLKSSYINLNLQTKNTKLFTYGNTFIVLLQKFLNHKNIILSNYTINFIGNILFLDLTVFFKTFKIFYYKKKKFKKLKFNNINLYSKLSKIVFKNFKFLNINTLNFSINVLNKEFIQFKNKNLLSFFYKKCKPFLNVLFQRRFTLFFDFIKHIVLLLNGLISAKIFVQLLSQLFKYLHKKTHTRFFVFFNLISNLLINIKNYKNIELKSNIKGLKFLIKGKLQGKMRASNKILQEGKVPTQSFNKHVDIAKQHVCTNYGVYGLTL
jgi:hypothetical protein